MLLHFNSACQRPDGPLLFNMHEWMNECMFNHSRSSCGDDKAMLWSRLSHALRSAASVWEVHVSMFLGVISGLQTCGARRPVQSTVSFWLISVWLPEWVNECREYILWVGGLDLWKYVREVRVCLTPKMSHSFILNCCWITLQVSHHQGWKTCVK